MVQIIYPYLLHAQSISRYYWENQKIEMIPQKIRERLNIFEKSSKLADITNAYSYSDSNFESQNKMIYIGIKTEKMITVYYLSLIENKNISLGPHPNISYEISRVRIIILSNKDFLANSFDKEKIFIKNRFYGLKEFLLFQNQNSLNRFPENYWGVSTDLHEEIEEIKDKNFENFKTIIQITEIPMDFHVHYLLGEKNIHENIENKENLELVNSFELRCYQILSKSYVFTNDIFRNLDIEKKLKEINNFKKILRFKDSKNKRRSYFLNLEGNDFNLFFILKIKLDKTIFNKLKRPIDPTGNIDIGIYPFTFQISEIIFMPLNDSYEEYFAKFDGFCSAQKLEIKQFHNQPDVFRIDYYENWVKPGSGVHFKNRTIFKYCYLKSDNQKMMKI